MLPHRTLFASLLCTLPVSTALLPGVAVGQSPTPPSATASVSYLRGYGWQSGPSARDVLTVETAARAPWADLFVMTEARHLTTRRGGSDPQHTFGYIEAHLRWHLGRVLGVPGVVVAQELNTGGGRLAWLHGLGLVRPVAGGAVRAHLYLRDDVAADGATVQLMVAGAARARWGGVPVRVAGYGDVVGAEGSRPGLVYGEVQVMVELAGVGRWGRGVFAGVELHHSRGLGASARPTEWVPQGVVQWAF